MGLLPAAVQAEAPIEAFTLTPTATQAGGHPNITFFFRVGNRITQHIPAPTCNCQDLKTATLHSPAGVIADPHVTPQCTAADFGELHCPTDSQVGTAVIGVGSEVPEPHNQYNVFAVYNLVPHAGQAGLLGINFPLLNFPIYEFIGPRTQSDYGLDLTTAHVTHLLPVSFLEEELWGVPASPSHTELRLRRGCDPAFGNPPCYPGVPSNSPEKPFLDNPTTCGVPLTGSFEVLSYDEQLTEATTPYPATTGCDQLSFNPSLFAQPTTTQTDSASGLEVNLEVPQGESPSVPSPSEIRSATVTLPPGFSINPNAADGKTVCTEQQARLAFGPFASLEEANCPEYSKVGEVTLTSSALPGPLPGYIYIGEPKSGERYRLILTANGFDVHVKLAGEVEPNPQTGQLTVSFKGSPPKFEGLPQAPFSDFNLHFFGSERGLLATPTQCGTYPVTSAFEPWDAYLPKQFSTQYFTLDSGPDATPCPSAPRPFGPALSAGVANNTAAAHTSFSLDLTRPDGDQDLSDLTATTPPGFSATLAGVAYCPRSALQAAAEPTYSGLAEQANPSCPAASQIGVSDTGAGAGTHPVYLPGKVYLAGPYKGAPLSLAVITPAVSGPYDLGNVVVQAALQVNPETAQITAVSDPLPQILDGIPLRLRSVLIELNRQGFALNPTNCDPFSLTAQIGGSEGALASLKDHFQVADCATLPFSPKLTVSLTGSTKRLGNPALSATLAYPGGSDFANLSSTEVVLPPTELLDNAHIQAPCTLKLFAQKACPPSTIIGFAKAETPLLEKPLEGPVYLRNGSHKLPDIVAALNGQIGEIDLVGHVDSIHSRLRTRFETIPDAPVSRFTLNLYGGRKGLTENSENLCSRSQIAAVTLDAQNGKSIAANQRIQLPCSPKHHKRAHLARARRASRGGLR